MNKTVSKNPVLRFKLGRKIQKAQFGDILNYATRYTSPLVSVAAAYDIYNAIPKNTVTKYLRDFYYGYDRDAYLKRLNKLKVKPNTITNTNNSKKRVKAIKHYGPAKVDENITFLKWNENPNTGKLVSGLYVVDGNKYWLGSDNTVTPIRPVEQPALQPVLQLGRPVVRRPPTYYATRAYRNKALPEGLNSRAAVMEYLKKLNRFGANIKEDGIWGDNTLAAYEAMLKKITSNNEGVMNLGTMNNIEARVSLLNPNSTISPDNWIAKAKSLNNLHYNIDPKFIMAKQGTKLISKNPVERFLQGRKLPTAPKAEDRYKYSSKSSEITPQGEKIKTVEVAPTGYWKFPATILERVNQQNDTTYIEVPTHTSILGGLIRPRVHARTVIRKANQPYNIGTYLTFTPSFVGPLFSPSDKLEYETLKRRFNTAWNLAK